MIADWNEAKLESIGKIVTGKTPSTSQSEYFGGNIPFITPTDMNGRRVISETERYLSEAGKDAVANAAVPSGAILVSCIGSDMGKSAIAGSESVTNQQINSLIVAAQNSALFVYYNLSNRRDELRAMAAGSAQPILNKSTFSQLLLRLPPPNEQQAIAAMLGALDDKIEQNRRTGAKLEGLARAVFKAWFVDFEPVKAKQSGATAFPGMPPETFAALPTRLTNSPLGPVPEGWEVTRWGDIASLEYGKSLKGYQDGAGGFRVFGTNGPIGWHTAQLADGPGIVIGRKGAYRGVHYSPGPFWAIDTAFYLKPKRPFSWNWAYYELLRVDINGMDSGSAIPSTSREDFYSLPVCLPRQAMFHGFDAVFAPVFEMLVAMNSESANLATLRDYLLPRLLSGRVRVSNAGGEASVAGDV